MSPSASTARAAAPQPSGASEILRALSGSIEPVRPHPLYGLATAVLALAMVLLPLVYVALAGAVAWGVWYHATENVDILSGHGGMKFKLFAYVSPLLVGVIGLLFMVKPLFAPRAKSKPPHSLDRETEPLLYTAVEKLARVVGAPPPRQINVDLEVNASASLTRGLLSFFSNDLTLTIGLPLASSLSLRNLMGVLAHELGHFAQGAGMRLQYLIRTVNLWFARVVYDRDAWDEFLQQGVKTQSHWAIQLIFLLAQGFVWLTRRILWVLMWVAHGLSCFMARQMEFDADRYEARVAGSEAFAESMLSMTLIGIAHEQAFGEIGRAWSERKLCEDLPGLTGACFRALPSDLRSKVEAAVLERRAGWFDTHPGDGDRIASARREAAKGLLTLERPASALFADFEKTCRETTRTWLEERLGPEASGAPVLSVAELMRRRGESEEEGNAFARFFRSGVLPARPLLLSSEALVARGSPAEALASLVQARARLLELASGPAEIARRVDGADTRAISAARAIGLRDAGFTVRPRDFDVDLDDPARLEEALRQADRETRTLGVELDAFDAACHARLSAALNLLGSAEVAAADPGAAGLTAEAARLVSVVERLAPVMRTLGEWTRDHAALEALLRSLEGNEQRQPLISKIFETSRSLTARLGEIRQSLQVPYPFEHAEGEVTIAHYLARALPDSEQVGEVFDTSGSMLARLNRLYFRAMSRLAQIGERTEAALGLAPLPDARPSPQDQG